MLVNQVKKTYLNELNIKQDSPILAQLRLYAENKQIPIIQDDGMHLLIQFLRASDAKRVLELGSAIGYFAICASLLANVEVVSLEIDPQMTEIAKKNIDAAGLDTQVRIINTDALSFDPSELGMFDLLFIDAAKAQYQKFFEKYEHCVNKGGMIVSDNLLFRGQVESPETIISRNRKQLVNKIKNYNSWLKEKAGYLTYFYEIGDGIAISIKQ